MKLDDAIKRDVSESAIVKLAKEMYPSVPGEVWEALYSNGYAMGSMYGFVEARATVEQTLMEYARGTAH